MRILHPFPAAAVTGGGKINPPTNIFTYYPMVGRSDPMNGSQMTGQVTFGLVDIGTNGTCFLRLRSQCMNLSVMSSGTTFVSESGATSQTRYGTIFKSCEQLVPIMGFVEFEVNQRRP